MHQQTFLRKALHINNIICNFFDFLKRFTCDYPNMLSQNSQELSTCNHFLVSITDKDIVKRQKMMSYSWKLDYRHIELENLPQKLIDQTGTGSWPLHRTCTSLDLAHRISCQFPPVQIKVV